jgi:hypothetical protein
MEPRTFFLLIKNFVTTGWKDHRFPELPLDELWEIANYLHVPRPLTGDLEEDPRQEDFFAEAIQIYHNEAFGFPDAQKIAHGLETLRESFRLHYHNYIYVVEDIIVHLALPEERQLSNWFDSLVILVLRLCNLNVYGFGDKYLINYGEDLLTGVY